jgi:divalent metal cation (Fe/Co/Zn/Cd) transporter
LPRQHRPEKISNDYSERVTLALERPKLEARARLLAWATIVWNVLEAVAAIASGVVAGSIALIGFGIDSSIEVFAAVVVLWRLGGIDEEREQRALKLIALSFFALGIYVVIEAVRDLFADSNPETSPVGIGIAVASLLIMPLLALAKKRTGIALGNRTVIADAAETKLCAYLSIVLLSGLLLDATLGWWWADPIAALGIAFLAVREGREAWNGDDCC